MSDAQCAGASGAFFTQNTSQTFFQPAPVLVGSNAFVANAALIGGYGFNGVGFNGIGGIGGFGSRFGAFNNRIGAGSRFFNGRGIGGLGQHGTHQREYRSSLHPLNVPFRPLSQPLTHSGPGKSSVPIKTCRGFSRPYTIRTRNSHDRYRIRSLLRNPEEASAVEHQVSPRCWPVLRSGANMLDVRHPQQRLRRHRASSSSVNWEGRSYPADVAAWAAASGLPAPNITTHLLAGASDAASDADGEVALDWQKAAEWWSYMTGTAATIVIVYGPNSRNRIRRLPELRRLTAELCGVLLESWGQAGSQWAAGDRSKVDASAQSAKFPVTAASGDNDSDDGTSKPVTDYPAESPYIIGCGGTSRPLTGPETVWNSGSGEGTGGGFSTRYSRPSWQPANSQGSGRMVPDCAAVADPATGHQVIIDGTWEVIGGTSAVAPMMAGFFGAANAARLKLGLPMLNGLQMLAMLWANPSAWFDITSGTNGTYKATIGPDPVSGLGRVLPALFAVITGASPTPPPVKPARHLLR